MKKTLVLAVVLLVAFAASLVLVPEFHRAVRDLLVPEPSEPPVDQPRTNPVQPTTPESPGGSGGSGDRGGDEAVRARVRALDAGWRLHLIEKLGLDPRTFRLVRGPVGFLPLDERSIAGAADGVPSAQQTIYRTDQTRSYADGYRQLLASLNPDPEFALANELRDRYVSWETYQTKFLVNNRTAKLTQLDLFAQFAMSSGLPSRAVGVFKTTAGSPLNLARDAILDPAQYLSVVAVGAAPALIARYAPSVSDAVALLRSGRGVNLGFDSRGVEATPTAFDTGYGSVPLAGDSPVALESINRKLSQSRWTVQGTIGRCKLVPVTRGGWFRDAVYHDAYRRKTDSKTWSRTRDGGWDAYFGQPDGALARRVTHLLIVSEYSIAVRTDAACSTDDLRRMRDATTGVWPLGSGSFGSPHAVGFTHDAAGAIEIKIGLARGAAEIWGVVVADAPD